MSHTVLLIDDDPALRMLTTRWLEHDGYDVVSCRNAEEGLVALSESLPSAVLLDLYMDGMDGLAVLDRIKRTHPHLPILMLTSESGTQTVVDAVKRGAWDYLTKPVSRTKLSTTVRNAIDLNEATTRLRQLEREVEEPGYEGMVGECAAMRGLFRKLDRAAPTDVTVLLGGESGTGKELAARAIHRRSGRRSGPFIAINCAAIPENLQESELFGHEKGSFTGAQGRRKGRFEQAHGGTLFLDEVGELTPALQAKLLRVLQERSFYRVGGDDEVKVDVRIIAATHKSLGDAAQTGAFREDLFYRLAVFEVQLPALRDRGDDVLVMARAFLDELRGRYGQGPQRLSSAVERRFLDHPWPGNVRELRNAIERAVVLAEGEAVELAHLPDRMLAPAPIADAAPIDVDAPDGQRRVEQIERDAIVAAIADTNGNLSEVVRVLGIPRSTLYRKLKRYGLKS